MLNTLPTNNVARIISHYIKSLELDMTQSLSDAETFKPSISKSAEQKHSFSSFLDDSYYQRSQSIERKEAMMAFLAEHLTYCDELIEYLLADKKALKQCSVSFNEEFVLLKLAAQAINDRLSGSHKVRGSMPAKESEPSEGPE